MDNDPTREPQGTAKARCTSNTERERGKAGTREVEGAGAKVQTREESAVELAREVRTSLQSILGALDLLLSTPLTSEQHEYAVYISSAAQDLKDAVFKTTTELTKMADTASNREPNSMERILATARETLGMDVSFVSQFTKDQMVFHALEGDAKSFGWREGDGVLLDDTYCNRMIEGELSNVIPDAKKDERVNQLDITREAGIGSYVGVPLRFSDGRVYGTLCSLSHSSEPQLQERDGRFMQVLAGLVADQLEREELEAENRRLEIKATEVNALLAALVARDVYTGDHSHAVVEYAEAVAWRMGLSKQEVAEVEQAAKLHDVGKIGIPDGLLEKPAALSEAEREEMRAHARIGEEIVTSTNGLAHLASIIRAVHEHWDGGGYPDRLSGEEIPLASRIISVCDAFHAMTSDRPYRQAMNIQAALDELNRNAGTQFCPFTVEVFLDIVGHSDGAKQHESGERELGRSEPMRESEASIVAEDIT
ncbi:MAG TPA: HD domain-containing phosphohydrolase [Rubrobacteraceae bacterium]|jgi:HD-GYP domain-containing protein (c-di-GMP phosphodiesterase class II)|nr:HD domain-containing phosphohydrolase [Rubrobacteraceae bacterium]